MSESEHKDEPVADSGLQVSEADVPMKRGRGRPPLTEEQKAARPEHVSAAFERLRDNHLGRWLRCEEAAPAYYVWVIENKGGDRHVHWAVHVPQSLRKAFGTKLPNWLARVAGTITCRESAINIKPVPNLRGLGLYFLKGIDPRYAARYGVKHVPQGLQVV